MQDAVASISFYVVLSVLTSTDPSTLVAYFQIETIVTAVLIFTICIINDNIYYIYKISAKYRFLTFKGNHGSVFQPIFYHMSDHIQ